MTSDPAQYDQMAGAYQAYADTNAYNTFCERPCTLSLLPAVQGKFVLDAACGPGFYAAWCAERGATVTAFDGSPAMVELARAALGKTAAVHVGSLTASLSFIASGSCDLVICALALDHVEDLTAPLSEFRRALKEDGVLVFSIEHPTIVFRREGHNYRDVEATERRSDRLGVIRGYRRPLGAYFDGLRKTGFVVEDLREGFPTPECEAAYPDLFVKLNEFPYFLSIRARALGASTGSQ